MSNFWLQKTIIRIIGKGRQLLLYSEGKQGRHQTRMDAVESSQYGQSLFLS